MHGEDCQATHGSAPRYRWQQRHLVAIRDGDGGCRYDEITGRDEARDGVPLLRPVVANGEAVAPLPDPDQARQRLRDQLASLPAAVRSLAPVAEPGDVYPVRISEALAALRRDTVSALD